MSAVPESPTLSSASREKKSFIRKSNPDVSQRIRRIVQLSFLLLNVYLAVQFLLWVRYYESQGRTHYFGRPAGIDGWLPIAGLMNLKYFAVTHRFPAIHPAAMVLTCAFLLCSLLLKKTFCSWLCPIGTVSEMLWKLGRRVMRRSLAVPRWLDIPLRGLKYLLMAFFLYIVVSMPAVALGDFMTTPFGIIADVKMLNFFRDLSIVGISIIALLVLLSLFIQNFWCRYLCPLGALMGMVSAVSPIKIRRDEAACIDCGKCGKACPAALPVQNLVQIRSLECTSCMQCVAACPVEDALQFSLPPRSAKTPAARWQNRTLRPSFVAAALIVLFVGSVGIAKATGHWQTDIPRHVYMMLVPHADEYGHQEQLP